MTDRVATLSALARFLDVRAPVLEEPQSGRDQAAVDATFATTGHKDGLVVELPRIESSPP